ncbi:NAD(P)/FAD-dependent oxidoreductase [Paenibacillus paridis]|uniref:NAD(P)/FAD-dependent oxidoreductase n=1 Tax=Paenibacillus paridis TaxID=2583376 RepID=UPI001120BA71|nr:NAD(P)/FAD-dependent oxidoreductase [Paenibacillus paridis]
MTAQAEMDIYDVTIIGGGPVGLFTAFYSGMRELRTKIIESAPQLGGKVQFYPEKVLHDVGGIAAITGADFIKQVEKQGLTFKPEVALSQRIEQLERLSDGCFRLISHTGETHYSRTVILAVGHGTFVTRKLDQEGAVGYEGNSLHYAVNSLDHFRGKQVLISGGGDSAVDWANALEPIAAQVTVVHRRDQFGGHESNVTQMRNSSVDIITPFWLKELHGDGEQVSCVTIEHLETKETRELYVDEVIVNHGITGDLGPIKKWGLELQEDKIVVDVHMKSNIDGVFAVGDVVTFPGKLKLIAGGFMEGPNAVNSAKKYLAPQEEVKALYSTHHEKLIAMHEQKDKEPVRS